MILAIVLRAVILLAIVAGHIGFWVSLFNRINATGLHRLTIKRIEKGIVLTCLAIPLVLWLAESYWNASHWRFDLHVWKFLVDGAWPSLSSWCYVYMAFAMIFFMSIGPIWLLHRPQFHVARDRFRILRSRIDRHLHRNNPNWQLGHEAVQSLRLPGNEIMHLEANIKLLRIDGIPDRFLGMRIGHLSDIHLTGELPAEYYRHAVDWMLSESPDLICLSGDLIDNPETLNSLRSIFGGLPKDLPKIFVLGNHDRACAMAEPTRCMMEDLGWMDAGKKDFLLQTPRGTLAIFGNERPWFHRDQTLRDSEIPSDCLALAISHSPDQIPWARQLGIPLMLCGHTHGGQIRFPWIGPIIAPSKYGSRFASGVFYQRPTLMHVSRGVSGIHTLRWGCVPEISILELASIAFSEPS